MRTQQVMSTFIIQTSEERKYFFLTCRERMILFLIERYESYGNHTNYKLNKTQAEVAERVGFNVRTIQRTILSLEKDGLITSEAGKICMTQMQYQALKKLKNNE